MRQLHDTNAFVYGRSTSKRIILNDSKCEAKSQTTVVLANVIKCTQRFVVSLDCFLAYYRAVSMHLCFSDIAQQHLSDASTNQNSHTRAQYMDSLLHTNSSSKFVSNQNISAEYLSLIPLLIFPVYSYHSLTFFIHHVPPNIFKPTPVLWISHLVLALQPDSVFFFVLAETHTRANFTKTFVVCMYIYLYEIVQKCSAFSASCLLI